MKQLAMVLTLLLAACSGDDDVQSLPKVITLDPSGPRTSTDVRGRIVFPRETTKAQLVALTFFSIEDPQTVVQRVAPGDGVDYEIVGLYQSGSVGAGVDLNGNGELDAGEWLGYGGGTIAAPMMLPGEAALLRPAIEETVVNVDIPLGELAQCQTHIGDACTESIACRYSQCTCPQNGYMRLGGKCEGGVCVGLSTEECTAHCETAEPLEPSEGPCFSWMNATET